MQMRPYTHPTSLPFCPKLIKYKKETAPWGEWAAGGEGEKQCSFTEGTGKNKPELW